MKPATKKLSRVEEVTAMLKRPSGYTAAAIAKKCGLLEHSVRALISGIAKNEKVTTSKEGKKPTVYSIAA